ncbi:MAG: M48 family metallopeptidase [Bacteroidetes bacterium]|nr:M48 family metallopeptidase [Bacteroidota bacterium]
MNKLLIIVLLLIANTINLNAQRYKPLESKGEIPKDFLQLSSEKYKQDAASLDSVATRKRRKDKDDFYLESNFIIDGLLKSGQVLFNDPVSEYINLIADTLLKDNPELRKELRFYTVKSPYVNAFATNQGMVFVNMGLVAQVENEAQLAYILCHEMVHYKERHAINSYVESMEISRAARRFQISYNDALLARSNYSKDLEIESDYQGLQTYLKSNYDPTTVEDAFFVLEFSHLPFDEVVYKREFLENQYMKLPENYYLEEVSQIESLDEYKDEYSTHPNCQERRDKLVPLLRTAETKGKSKYLVGEERFKAIQKIARNEMSRYYLNERQYGAALYNSFLLLEQDKNDLHAAKINLKALNYLVKYKNRESTYGVLRSYYYIQGESQQLYHVLSNISAEELNTLALSKAWEFHTKYPKNKVIKKVVNELAYELALYHNNDLGKYRKLVKETEKEPEPDTIVVEEKKLSKYDKIKKKIGREDYENDSTNVLYAFSDHLDDSAFVNNFSRMAKIAARDGDSSDYDALSWRDEFKRAQKQETKGLSLGIDKILMLYPRYYKVDNASGSQLRFQKTEDAQINFIDQIKTISDAAGLEVELLSPVNLGANETNKFNDYAALSEWVRERYDHSITLPNKTLPSTAEFTDSLIDVYGTRYLAVTRVISIKNNDNSKYIKACVCCLGGITAPLAVYYLVKPDVETIIEFNLLDLKTGEIIMEEYSSKSMKDYDYLVKSKLYDIFNQVHRSK